MKNIFITGAGGCVGNYLSRELASNPDYHLYLFVRTPRNLTLNAHDYKNVTVIHDDLRLIDKHAKLLKEMDYVIHLAADWGGNEGNFDYSVNLFNLIDPVRCQKVIYFSTASILGSDNQPLEAAEKFGTHYIRSKYRFFKKLPELPIYSKVITLFPTWVLGGDKKHPYSHALQGILDMQKWLWLIRFFTVDITFHFIHAKDMAHVTRYLLEHEVKDKSFVLGNRPITASTLIRQIAEYFKTKVYFQIPINFQLVYWLAFITGKKLHPWDLYCLNKKHFVHQTVNAATFGLPSKLDNIKGIIKEALGENI